MTILSETAFMKGRRDEEPNVELARKLAETGDTRGVAEIAANLFNGNQAVSSDCLKVLYETGYRNPGLIAAYRQDFLRLLESRNNRMVWGAMIALGSIAQLEADELFGNIELIYKAIRNGSVITVDNGIKTLSGIASQKNEYREAIFPFLLDHLRSCRAKDVPQHAESIGITVDNERRAAFLGVLKSREPELSEAQKKRLRKLCKEFSAGN